MRITTKIYAFLFFVLALLCFLESHAQNNTKINTFTVSGTVRDSLTGELLYGAACALANSGTGTTANAYGFYSLPLPVGSQKLIYSFVGYEKLILNVDLTKDTTLNISLLSESKALEEVVVEGKSYQEKVQDSQMSIVELNAEEAKRIPVVFGEVDLIKVLQLKPGVQSGGEGTSGLYVRGGGPDQNLVLLDEAVVYNAAHLFGFFSIFNSDAVRNVQLYKGDFPAQYGGRLSSVVDVRLKEGNRKRFSAQGGIGLIASRLTIETPIIKDKASLVVAMRRTYFDVFTEVLNDAQKNNPNWNRIPRYYFYDVNIKFNVDLSKKDKLFVSGYFGRDVFGFNSPGGFNIDFKWGNATSTVRWNRIISPKLFLNTSFVFSDYQYNITNKFDVFSFSVGSGVRDMRLKTDLDYYLNDKHYLKLGAQLERHDFDIGRLNANSSDGNVSFQAGNTYTAYEGGIYLNEEFKVNEKLSLDMGMRLSAFLNDSANYAGLEPRFSVKWAFRDNFSVKMSYARMLQYMHLVANSGASLPTDIWYPSSGRVKPQISQQVAAGISWTFAEGRFLLTNELYFKDMQRQIDFRDGANLFVNNNLDQEFVFGRGWAYGNEIYIEKKRGKTTGWLGYTLSWSLRQFASLNDNRVFPYRYDRRHDASLVIMHEFSRRWTFSGTWVYGTGNAITLPIGRYVVQDIPGSPISIIPQYSDRNAFRLRPYHRLDLGLIYRFFPRWGESDLTLSIYNAYSRMNPFFVYFEETKDLETDATTGFKAKQVSLFPIIPAITYNFKFGHQPLSFKKK